MSRLDDMEILSKIKNKPLMSVPCKEMIDLIIEGKKNYENPEIYNLLMT